MGDLSLKYVHSKKRGGKGNRGILEINFNFLIHIEKKVEKIVKVVINIEQRVS